VRLKQQTGSHVVSWQTSNRL